MALLFYQDIYKHGNTTLKAVTPIKCLYKMLCSVKIRTGTYMVFVYAYTFGQ